MFEPPSKRSCPSPFRLSQAVPKRFLKAYTHVPEKAMGTVSLFVRIFPALVALLTSELCFHKFKATLVLRVEMTKTTADGKSKVERPYFSSKPYTILSQHDIENAIAKAQSERLRVRSRRSATFTPSAHVRRQSLPVWPPTLNNYLYLYLYSRPSKQTLTSGHAKDLGGLWIALRLCMLT